MFLHVFVRPSFLFSLFCSVSVGKSCFSVKKFIWASKRRAEHPFAGQNTQQLISCYLYIYSIFFFKLNLFFAFFFSRECHCHIGAEIYLQKLLLHGEIAQRQSGRLDTKRTRVRIPPREKFLMLRYHALSKIQTWDLKHSL